MSSESRGLAGLHRRLPAALAEEAAAALAAPALTVALRIAVGVSIGRIAFTARTLPRLTAR